MKRTVGILCIVVFCVSLIWLIGCAYFTITSEGQVYIGKIWISEGTSLLFKDGHLSMISKVGSYSVESPFVGTLNTILWLVSSCMSLIAGIVLLRKKE